MTNSDTVSQDTTFAFPIVVVAAVMFGTVPYFAVSLTQMGIAPPAVAFYRYLIAGMVFLPALWGQGGRGRF
jgi:drug/metabolite transporter (DMT)-like permease